MKNTVPTSQRLISRRIIWGLLFVCYTEVSHVYPPLPTAVIIFAFRAGPTSPIKIKLTLLLAIAFTNRVIIQLQLWACSTKTTFLPSSKKDLNRCNLVSSLIRPLSSSSTKKFSAISSEMHLKRLSLKLVLPVAVLPYTHVITG